MTPDEVRQNILILNDPKLGHPFHVSIEGDKIVARWRWKDGYFANFTGFTITKEVEEFRCIVELFDNHKYKMVDKTSSTAVNIGTSGVKAKKQVFIGKSTSIQKEITFGKKNDTGETGIVSFDFNSKRIHEPIKNFLQNYGYRKKGLF